MKRRQAGFSFVEILIVMSIIAVLVSMVVVVVPMIQEKGRQAKSTDNVRSMLLMYTTNGIEVSAWPKYNGKSFILWLVATGKIKRNTDNLAILFSPGDDTNSLKSAMEDPKVWDGVTIQALKTEGHEEFKSLTSYAGRRNNTPGHKLSAQDLEESALVICDDDLGAAQHSQGMILGYSNSNAKFIDWMDLLLDGQPPTNLKDLQEAFLGDNAPQTKNGDGNELKHMSSGM